MDKNSKANGVPLSRPLVRKTVAMPKTRPERSVRASRESSDVVAVPVQLATSNSHPTKVSRAKGLSAYGADRNRPAGDRMCRRAAQRAQRESANRRRPSW